MSDYEYDGLDWLECDDQYEARMEARADEIADRMITCPACGTIYDEGCHRATRWEPGYYDQPECPKCSMSPEEAQAYRDHSMGEDH